MGVTGNCLRRSEALAVGSQLLHVARPCNSDVACGLSRQLWLLRVAYPGACRDAWDMWHILVRAGMPGPCDLRVCRAHAVNPPLHVTQCMCGSSCT